MGPFFLGGEQQVAEVAGSRQGTLRLGQGVDDLASAQEDHATALLIRKGEERMRGMGHGRDGVAAVGQTTGAVELEQGAVEAVRGRVEVEGAVLGGLGAFGVAQMREGVALVEPKLGLVVAKGRRGEGVAVQGTYGGLGAHQGIPRLPTVPEGGQRPSLQGRGQGQADTGGPADEDLRMAGDVEGFGEVAGVVVHISLLGPDPGPDGGIGGFVGGDAGGTRPVAGGDGRVELDEGQEHEPGHLRRGPGQAAERRRGLAAGEDTLELGEVGG